MPRCSFFYKLRLVRGEEKTHQILKKKPKCKCWKNKVLFLKNYRMFYGKLAHVSSETSACFYVNYGLFIKEQAHVSGTTKP